MRDKTATHLTITISLTAAHSAPGSLPARTAAGSSVPGGLLRQWLCDNHLTRTVLSLGPRVLEASHTERTLKTHERRALNVQWGGQCAQDGCTHSQSTGHALVPHHQPQRHHPRLRPDPPRHSHRRQNHPAQGRPMAQPHRLGPLTTRRPRQPPRPARPRRVELPTFPGRLMSLVLLVVVRDSVHL